MTPTTSKARQALKTPRAAAIVGIVFSVVLATSQVLIRLAIAATPEETGVWRSDSAHRTFLGVALYLVPFAGIAFLWFIGVIRDRMGAQEDRFFATVFLGSGLLFVAMLFAAAALAGGLLANTSSLTGSGSPSETWQLGYYLTFTFMTTYAMRMAGVFMLVTSTITLRTAFMAVWLGWLGYVFGGVLLLSAGFVPWIELLFPLWAFVVSARTLVGTRSGKRRRERAVGEDRLEGGQ